MLMNISQETTLLLGKRKKSEDSPLNESTLDDVFNFQSCRKLKKQKKNSLATENQLSGFFNFKKPLINYLSKIV